MGDRDEVAVEQADVAHRGRAGAAGDEAEARLASASSGAPGDPHHPGAGARVETGLGAGQAQQLPLARVAPGDAAGFGVDRLLEQERPVARVEKVAQVASPAPGSWRRPAG